MSLVRKYISINAKTSLSRHSVSSEPGAFWRSDLFAHALAVVCAFIIPANLAIIALRHSHSLHVLCIVNPAIFQMGWLGGNSMIEKLLNKNGAAIISE